MVRYQELFSFPAVHTDILFGCGSIEKLPQKVTEAGARRVLIVSDSGLQSTGIIDTIRSILEAANIGVSLFCEVPQDSSTTVIERAAGQFRDDAAEAVIGIGGGSSLDAGKAIAAAVTNPGPLVQYAGIDKLTHPPVPMIAVPTTSGTGSEVSYWSVMTNDANQVKIAIGGALVFPKTAVCDPDLTIGLPPLLTATTGMDALTHAIESFVNRSYQPISAVLTHRAIELIGGHLVRATRDGSDREARYAMMLGSTLAGMGMNPTRLGIAHALAMPLGSWDLKIPHGAAIAVTLPHVMEFNAVAAPTEYAAVARALGVECAGRSDGECAERGVEFVRTVARETGIPKGLGELGLTEELIPKVCEEAMKSGNISVNPRTVSREELEALCKAAL
ncbi:MAG: iron-containing alcohol dehydrogenase [Spirochaetales bacterium]|nr:iron-containing alcohol dehydrogenase [Spirochaetales bacterium]